MLCEDVGIAKEIMRGITIDHTYVKCITHEVCYVRRILYREVGMECKLRV